MISLLGIRIIDRIKESGLTQKILSTYSDTIVTRLGFHEITDSVCSREATLILHVKGTDTRISELRSELQSVGGILLREAGFDGPQAETEVSGSADVACVLAEHNKADIPALQKALTSFGCNIRTRLGVNETFLGGKAGLIILELKGEADQRELLVTHLGRIPGIHIRVLRF